MTRSLRYFQPEILPTRMRICSDMASAIKCGQDHPEALVSRRGPHDWGIFRPTALRRSMVR
jgi:hypothetical protein